MKFVPSKLHGMADYATALLLIFAPILFLSTSIPQTGKMISIAAGIGLIIYSLITDYSLSARKAISFKLHLTLDFIAGIVFLALPFILGYSGIAKNYFLVIGAAIVLLVLFTNNDID